jgi:hypothetical protein
MKTQYVTVTLLFMAIISIGALSFQSEKPVFDKNGLKVYELKGSPDYPDAQLKLISPENNAELAVGSDTFKFELKNYELGTQTPDASQKMCANSAKGQHIHFILDNSPYVASYNPQIVADVKPGHHVLLAFLSRSYHESLKHPRSYILKEFNAGKDARDEFDEKAPHLFYSRPKGEYVGEQETKRVVLDFYLFNCTLSENGYKVRATINGNQVLLTKWAPYVMEGLPIGESKIKLELLDSKGQLVKSPFNGVERTITLKNEPLK